MPLVSIYQIFMESELTFAAARPADLEPNFQMRYLSLEMTCFLFSSVFLLLEERCLVAVRPYRDGRGGLEEEAWDRNKHEFQGGMSAELGACDLKDAIPKDASSLRRMFAECFRLLVGRK